MIIHANTTRNEFIEFLYRTLQDANMPVQVLDCVEDLRAIERVEQELAEQIDATEQAEHDASDLYSELAAMVETFNDREDLSPKMLEERLKIARKALVRHIEYK